MIKSPLISVITVTYNASGVIDRTLQSVANQEFQDYEHLIIDGASSDNTLKQVANFKNDKIRIISEPDKGLYDAMNKGLKEASGDYVIFLNAGDKFHNTHTLSLYARGSDKDMDIIYGDTVVVNNEGNMISKRHLNAPESLSFKSFSKGMLICHQAFMVKRSLAPLYNLNYRFSADFDWCIRCIKKTQPSGCMNLHCATIDYLSDGLSDKNKFKSLKERFRIMSRHYGFLPTALRHLGFIYRALRRGKL